MKRPQRSRAAPRAATAAPQGATRHRRTGLKDWLRNQGRLHAQVLVSSLGRLYRAPLSSLMTVAVIAIALALPSGLLVILDNLQRLNTAWDGTSSISLFLKQQTGEGQAERLARDLEGWPAVAGVRVIDRTQALEEFRELSGFGEALQALDSNPLPHVLEVRATAGVAEDSDQALASLVDELGRLPEVELAQLDLQWVKRFAALMDIGRRGILVVGALLALAVLLIVGNTIRLDIQNRSDEIEVSKLIGATDTFIRRPFLYTGLWYGLLGALLAWLLVSFGFWLVDAPVRRLAGLYDSGFLLSTLSWTGVGTLLLAGIALGLAGSWVAVGRHLDAIEPS
jgi:cell division transport system permease protein